MSGDSESEFTELFTQCRERTNADIHAHKAISNSSSYLWTFVFRASDNGRLFDGYSGRILFVSALAWAVLQTGRFTLPLLLPEIRRGLSLTLGQTGLVLTLLQGIYAFSQYPSGRFSDSWSRISLIIPGLGVLTLSFLLVGGTSTYSVLLLGAAILGLGKGLYSIPSRAFLSDLFGGRRGRALGFFSAGSDFGGILASVVAVLVLQYMTWRAPFLSIAVVLGFVTALYFWWSQEPYTIRRTDLNVLQTIGRLIKTPRQRRILLAYALFYFMVNGVINFLPTYLRTAKGLSPVLASGAYSLLFLVGMGAKPAAGELSDRISRRTVSLGGLLLSAISLSIVLLAHSVEGVLTATVLFAVGYKAQIPLIDATVMENAPTENVGGDLGAARGLFQGIGSLGPAYIGFMAQTYDYSIAFAGLAICLVASTVIVFFEDQ